MPRPRSQRVDTVRARLLERLDGPLVRPGDRFLSARALATQYGLSYQTAHRLLSELVGENRLVRRQGSGTYVPGRGGKPAPVLLLFHRRAQRPGSFGERLLAPLRPRLDREHINWSIRFVDPARATRLPAGALPVLWEAPAALAACLNDVRPAVLLHDRPPAGLQSRHVDSISIDDFAGGVYAAEILASRGPRVAVLAGPPHDQRSRARVEGFCSVTSAAVIHADGWFLQDGLRAARAAVDAGPDGVFCCNDRLAEGVLAWCAQHDRPRPHLVGFDDAPVAARLDLTTIAIPWEALADAVTAAIVRRLSNPDSLASSHVLAPHPVLRGE